MPIYEYVCDKCSHHLEALQKLSDEPLVFCPECGETTLRKQVSAAAFRLKGTGWYETDFKNSDKKKPAESKSEGKDEGKDKKAGGESAAGSENASSTKDKASAASTSPSTTTSSSKSSSGKSGSSASDPA
ncbi:MAG TPA: FmdB family transcriptional regulator [Gammaproteobacteria bacterium]|jgi:putative FmdB family regulatory protein|nr:FmdB family transcriptional regulator [Acidiferrobacteraceae bacterium]MDP6398979.1 zinc ribbon domain-containing protein [Arenicellales bacterium]HCX87645.1 FmdB family transcriptional regulator [Gammaproteobacteria bacterium]MDP6550916.1 zinc ribbon domain-containing protein [Arenicellales bacterium]MDP6790708.1 zinc ribbon domain-containing protein [Arenicellales bacterium]|tara:strand:+ start:524 stop:913 length:390 start_codon:yes stop_codon:yes gene_type:complete